MSQADITSENNNDFLFGGDKTESNASYSKKWKLKNRRLSISTVENSTGRLQTSTTDMSGRTRLASTLDEILGEEQSIDMPENPSGLNDMQNFIDIVGELPIEVPFYGSKMAKMKPKLKNRRIPGVPTKDGVPVWMLDQGAKNIADPAEATAIMEVLDEAATLFCCVDKLDKLQALHVLHTEKEPDFKRRGMRMQVPLTADVLARFDSCFPEEPMTVEVPCMEVMTKTKLKNRSLLVPRY